MATLRITREDIAQYLDRPIGRGKACGVIHTALAAFDLAYPGGVWFDPDWTLDKALAYCRKRPVWALWLQKKGLMPRLEAHDDSLKGQDLSGLKLWKPDLSKADLRGCKLDGAKLFRANLIGANLSGVNCSAMSRLEAAYSDNTVLPILPEKHDLVYIEPEPEPEPEPELEPEPEQKPIEPEPIEPEPEPELEPELVPELRGGK